MRLGLHPDTADSEVLTERGPMGLSTQGGALGRHLGQRCCPRDGVCDFRQWQDGSFISSQKTDGLVRAISHRGRGVDALMRVRSPATGPLQAHAGLPAPHKPYIPAHQGPAAPHPHAAGSPGMSGTPQTHGGC